ncbi:glutamate synthase large subunit [Peribacillus cavernae]|uniref:Glutamate synthase large subunit n=1 Tax=Peribacillus cavernae TaxID=1674310 RepID=A0A3S0VEJ4_9BACI|nr:glutamate synthase large subunit [Peribacillus cavernae]MDQ0216985.1 glutamate synthase (NADPH/NADH) large chain/glutamate synthase (ferredoxin) [Peribacillus cavernae]RUQ30529.1 glutamate synthase large subunit [Peribacillus cavernae]
MSHYQYPLMQGLYDPKNEHDACGIGFIANIKGNKSHEIVQLAVKILCNLEHRGGQGADTSTGDGAGIMTQIPHSFLKRECKKEDIDLPEEGKYGVGMIFLSPDPKVRKTARRKLVTIIEEEGQQLLGWRTVPVNDSFLGEEAKKSKPFIQQIFIAPASSNTDQMDFERKLYVIRRRAEKEIREAKESEHFYVASLSTSTIVYKGMLIPEQIDTFYIELNNPNFKTAMALVHSRFSTNTFPSWERSHPNRYVIHNGEFNTLKGNVNWMRAREMLCRSDYFNESELEKVLPVIDEEGSDSSMFDNCFEFLRLSGRSLAHTAMMMIPEPWANDEMMSEEKRSFYEYHSCLMEPWDGPAAVVFTDGKQIGACLDRNGLRPARYYVTKDDMIILSSEIGVLDIPPEDIAYKERLRPGKMLLVDLVQGRIIPDEEIKNKVSSEYPYKSWLTDHLISLDDLPGPQEVQGNEPMSVPELQLAFGYTNEEMTKMLKAMVTDGVDPIGSMGNDTPLAFLSKKPQLLYNYFKQLFAQVTNPPIDATQEEIITDIGTTIGAERNLVKPEPESCRKIRLNTPILTEKQFTKLCTNPYEDFRVEILSILFDVTKGKVNPEEVLDCLFNQADKSIQNGAKLLILSDRGVNGKMAAIPALLAVSGLHHYLTRKGTRTKVSLIVESGEPRVVHHFACLLGYGAEAIYPYLAYATLKEMINNGDLRDTDYQESVHRYIKAATKGVVKVISKMGISTIQSYRGAQIFEAIGIHMDVIDRYFTRTASRLGGIGLKTIFQEALMRNEQTFSSQDKTLDSGDEFQWRRDGEDHQYNPQTIHLLQQACRMNDYQLFKQYSKLLNDHNTNLQSLRGLLAFKNNRQPIPIEEVEPVEEIYKRFKTGAMSFGSISEEAHESLAIAMNRIGGRSNSGEGGEAPERFTPSPNGDLRRSAIKQVASGRFGVSSYYLVNADEIQIKIAQGAKPGEGGHLPGKKVYPWIAEVRGSTPGVGLISPPPHHDIYSIEDLAELIFNLKNANPNARISVKLVSAVGVGTIATGVAKCRADLVLISGYDGGTGAAPRTGITHTGLPWEIGLAETHQTLMLNHLRDRIVVEADGKMMTGRDIVIAALLGAEEYGFSTAPLVVLGCIYMRVCHLDTCPVGVATQNPELRKKFTGKPEHVMSFMSFIANEVREIMSELGFRSISEMIGCTDVLETNQAIDHWKTKGIDLTPLFYQPDVPAHVGRYATRTQYHGIDETLDIQELIPLCEPALEHREPVKASLPILNINRSVGTLLGSEISKKYGQEGLPMDTIQLRFSGFAGQSFGAFIPKGMTLILEGDSNDYVGKGLSGGKIIVYPPKQSTFVPEENIITGNVAFYGATSGEGYIRGIAGERFCVRNSGANVVVEGVGDHGCEYMTGGQVVILGPTGRNFAAGLSGGVAYVFNELGDFSMKCNQEMVFLEPLVYQDEMNSVKAMIEKHAAYTKSTVAKRILENWDHVVSKFIRVIPKDYLEMQQSISRLVDTGLTNKEAAMKAFEERKRAVAD